MRSLTSHPYGNCSVGTRMPVAGMRMSENNPPLLALLLLGFGI